MLVFQNLKGMLHTIYYIHAIMSFSSPTEHDTVFF